MRSSHCFATLCVIATSALLAAAAPAKDIGFRIVDFGTSFGGSTGVSGDVARIVRDRRAAYALLFAWSMEGTARRISTIDFRRRSLVVVAAHEWPDSSYGVLPGAITVTGSLATFTGTIIQRPGLAFDADASPWVMLSVPREAVAKAALEVPVTLRCGPPVRCDLGVT